MREILFRGKSSTTGEWIEGCLVTATVNGETFYLIFADEFTFDNLSIKANKHACVDPETIGQSIGICDKNGKKIFEGDIVDASDSWWNAYDPAGHDSPIIAVEWNDATCGFDPFADYDCDCGVYIHNVECRVIGNIYDDAWMLTTDAPTLLLTLEGTET